MNKDSSYYKPVSQGSASKIPPIPVATVVPDESFEPELAIEVCNWLDVIEKYLVKMLLGIHQVLTDHLPRLLKELFRGIARVGLKAVRVAVIALALLAVVFGPFVVACLAATKLSSTWFVVFGLLWLGIAIGGAIYGVIRIRKRRADGGK
jgi:hypothetical protein